MFNLGLLCDLLWSDPDKDITGWSENDRGVSFTFGPDIVSRFLQKHDIDLICRAHQVVEDGYEFFSKRQLVTIFSAPNYCGEFDNAGAMMSVDDSLMCSFQVSCGVVLIGVNTYFCDRSSSLQKRELNMVDTLETKIHKEARRRMVLHKSKYHLHIFYTLSFSLFLSLSLSVSLFFFSYILELYFSQIQPTFGPLTHTEETKKKTLYKNAFNCLI